MVERKIVAIRDGLTAVVLEHPGVLRKREARLAIAKGVDAAAVWAVALCGKDASSDEIRDTAEVIAWQDVSGAEEFRQKCRKEFGL